MPLIKLPFSCGTPPWSRQGFFSPPRCCRGNFQHAAVLRDRAAGKYDALTGKLLNQCFVAYGIARRFASDQPPEAGAHRRRGMAALLVCSMQWHSEEIGERHNAARGACVFVGDGTADGAFVQIEPVGDLAA